MDEHVEQVEQNRVDEPPVIEGSSSTQIDYTLNFTGWPTVSQIVAVAVATAAYTVLSWFSSTVFPATTGVSFIFIAIGFGIPFALWFGGWSFLIAYIGNFIGAGLMTGTPILTAIPFGATDLIQLGVPVVLYRLFATRFGVSPIGKDVFTVKGFVFFLVCAVIPNNVIGGLYGNFILVQFGINPPSVFLFSWFTWAVSNIVVTIIIGSILLSALGPIVERYGLTIRNAFR